MAPMHSGFLEEYPLIRVDNFTSSLPPLPPKLPLASRDDWPTDATRFIPPHISLLSHPHTDHLAGLASLSRQSAPIYCSTVTKGLLLALERKADRERFDAGLAARKCPYRSLRRSQRERQALDREAGTSNASSWDILHSLPFNSPVVLPYTARKSVRLTLLSSNHMPGSTMFLVEGDRGAILHTGDMRAEEHFIHSLLPRSHLCRLSLQHAHMPVSPANSRKIRPVTGESDSEERHVDFISTPRLCNLYLDTERLLDWAAPPTKSEAILDVIQLLRLFPRSTKVHISCWTSGYEEFLLSLANAFPEEEEGKIHLDRYKKGMYQIMALDPDFEGLKRIGSTEEELCGRFCACEEKQCIESSDVRIEADECMDAIQWKACRKILLEKIEQARRKECPWPRKIALPLQRHSPLREIYAMIRKLQPITVTANTAHCPARFLLAEISQRLSLSGCKEEPERQRSLMGSKGRIDASEWKKCCEAWSQSLSEEAEAHQEADEAFFRLVQRFHSTLRARSKPNMDRVSRERMDAEEAPPASSVLLPSSAPVSGPWTGEGRYITDSSPFLTPAMRKAAAERGGLSPEKSKGLAGGPILTVELSSRYLAYASMFLGWKIRNPSRYRPELAWRAIRKMRPDLAKKSEKALLKELGLPIPAWEEAPIVTQASAITPAAERFSAPKTPPLPAARIETIMPSTPEPRKRPLQESISPLQLGATALLHRLDEEAASQDLNANDTEGRECDIELVKVVINSEPIPRSTLKNEENEQKNTPSLLNDFTALETQLREAKRRRIWSESGTTGGQVFRLIMNEWENPPRLLDVRRFSAQLNLIGAAARSKRGRAILSWENVDFHEAYRLLSAVYSTANTSLPLRGRAVLRFLK